MKTNRPKIHQLFSLALAAAAGVLVCHSARGTILWDGDANNGTIVFGHLNIENNPGVIDVVTDGTYGKVFRMICYDNGSTKVRTEASRMRNFQPVKGNNYYFGWRHKWGPLPTLCGKWQVLEQIHLSGTGAAGGPVPFGLHVDGCDSNMEFEYQNPSGTAKNFLVLPFPRDSWHSFVYYMRWSESESDGFVEFWYDGTKRTLANGSQRYPSAWCFPNATSYWKWGVYRSGSGGPIGTSYAYLWRPRAATTFAEVDPGGGSPDPIAGFKRIVARHSSKDAVVASASTADGANIFQYSYASGTTRNDEWDIISVGSGYYRIMNRHSGKAMVVQNASTADGANVFQWTYGGSATNDEWQFVSLGGGYYRIVNRNSGKSLEVAGGSLSNTANIQQNTYSGATHQQWQLISIP